MSRGLFLLLLTISCSALASGEFKPFTAQSVREIGEAQAGRPLVLVFWSASCAPCIKELPRWSAWQKKHRRAAVVLVNVDPLDEQAGALATLRRRGIRGLDSWGLAEAVPERVYWSVDPKWHGETPYLWLIDAQRRAQGIFGAVDAAWLSRWYREQTD